jgi:hypothetical protein
VAALARQLADEMYKQRTEDQVGRELLALAVREFAATRTRFAWLVASPAVLGAVLLIFAVAAWASGLVEPSGTTSTALVVSTLLVLVPSFLAAWRGTTAETHAHQVFKQAEAFLKPPPRPDDPA